MVRGRELRHLHPLGFVLGARLAPLEADIQKLMATKGPAYFLKDNPYAEWYANTIRIRGSPSQRHHPETYGPDFSYDDFKPMFNEAARGFDPVSWSDLFAQAHARYVVLTTKHHDGFTLWPSRHPNPHKDFWHAECDLVGDVTSAIRDRNIKMGLYYSADSTGRSIQWSSATSREWRAASFEPTSTPSTPGTRSTS